MSLLECRIAALERECRFFRGLLTLAGLALLVMVAWGAAEPIPDIVRGRKLEIVDANGVRVIEMLSQQPDPDSEKYTGNPEYAGGLIRVNSLTGQTVVKIGTGLGSPTHTGPLDWAPGVRVFDSNGNRVAALRDEGGAGSVSVSRNGKVLVFASALMDDGSLGVLNEKGNWLVLATGGRAGCLFVGNENAKVVVQVSGRDPSVDGGITIFDRRQKELIRLGSRFDGHGLITAYGQDGQRSFWP